MYLLKVLFKLNLVTCREFIYLFLEKDVEKVGTPQKAYQENHLHIIFYTKTKRNEKKKKIIWPLLSLSLELIEK